MCTTWHQSLCNTFLCADAALPPRASPHIHPGNRLDNLLEGYNEIRLEAGQLLLQHYGVVDNETWSVSHVYPECSMIIIAFPFIQET